MDLLSTLVPGYGIYKGIVGNGVKDKSSYTGQGNTYKVGDIATEGVDNSQDSLTQFLRSMQNYLATTGKSSYGQGEDKTNYAASELLPGGKADTAAGTAMGTTGTALDTSNTALNTLKPAQSYWEKILSGDQDTMDKAIAPYATQAGTNYANATSQAQMNAPRGGYAAAMSANLPFALNRDVNNQLFSLQPQAATNLNTIAGTQGQIGGLQNNIAGTQGQIGGLYSQIANILGQLGISQSSLGANLLNQSGGLATARRGQNTQVDMNNINNLTHGLTALTGDISQGYNVSQMNK
jgi:hypothetical protein